MDIAVKILTMILAIALVLILEPRISLAQVNLPASPQPKLPEVHIATGASNPSTPTPFSPSQTNLVLGSLGSITVRWVNDDSALHTVKSFDNIFDSGVLSPKQHFDWTFYSSGNYNYYCTLHPYMTGVIIITPFISQ